MSSENEKIAEFASIGNVSAERARFYLEASGWDLQTALSQFYESGGSSDHGDVGPPKPASVQYDNRVNTLFSQLEHDDASDSPPSDSDDQQRFYVGGSTHSGQQVVGPPPPNRGRGRGISDPAGISIGPGGNYAEEFFRMAQGHGLENVSDDVNAMGEEQAGSVGTASFSGHGNRLGDSLDPTPTTKQQPTTTKPPSAMSTSHGPARHRVFIWRNGFSVDDGPLRPISVPENAAFLAYAQRGQVPLEFQRKYGNRQVELDFVSRQTEDYQPPPKVHKAFEGEGHRLGSPTPAVSANPPKPASSSTTSSAAPVVDESAPTTQLQIRLPDGTAVRARFNLTHRVGDIRAYLQANCAQLAGRSYSLMTTYPKKEYNDHETTIEAAALNNASMMVKFL